MVYLLLYNKYKTKITGKYCKCYKNISHFLQNDFIVKICRKFIDYKNTICYILNTGCSCKIKGKRVRMFMKKTKDNKGITLVALVITIVFSYDENVKSSNNKGFLLQTI